MQCLRLSAAGSCNRSQRVARSEAQTLFSSNELANSSYRPPVIGAYRLSDCFGDCVNRSFKTAARNVEADAKGSDPVEHMYLMI